MEYVLNCTLLFFFNITAIHAQYNGADLMKAVIAKATRYPNGYYEACYTGKAIMKNDTNRLCGRVYFSRELESRDTIAKFFVYGDGAGRGFDGVQFYYLNASAKTVKYRAIPSKAGVLDLLTRNIIGNLAFEPFLYCPEKTPLDFDKLDGATVDNLGSSDSLIVRLTVWDSFPNPLKINERDATMARTKQEFDILLADTTLCAYRRWGWYFPEPSFSELRMRNVKTLPGRFDFQTMLNLDSLREAGFSIQELIPVNDSLNKLHISLDDTVPNFALTALDGKIVRSETIRKGLILLEFWYKSCAPCLKGHTVVNNLYRKYSARGLTVFGVNGIDENLADLQQFIKQREMAYPVLVDKDRLLAHSLNVSGYPTYILLDATSKKVLYAGSGLPDDLEARLSAIIEPNLK